MLIIGESLNATRQAVKDAVKDHDARSVQALAREQVEAGASMLDVNAAVQGRREVDDLPWMVEVVQAAVDVPLALDSSDPDALLAAMRVHRGRPLVNSLSAEADKMDRLLPIVAGADCSVIVLCMDDHGIPDDVAGRLRNARVVVQDLVRAGKRLEDIHVDPLVMSISVDPRAARTTLGVISALGASDLDGVQITGGLSNVSYGMPARRLINRVFVTAAMALGLSSCIVDVRDRALMSSIHAATALLEEGGTRSFIKAYRAGRIQA